MRTRTPITALAVLLVAAVAQAARVETIDARTIEGTVSSITAEEVVVVSDGRKQVLPRRDVADIYFQDVKEAEASDSPRQPFVPMATQPASRPAGPASRPTKLPTLSPAAPVVVGKAATMLATFAGDRIFASRITAANGHVDLACSMLGDVRIPMLAVSHIYLADAGVSLAACQQKLQEMNLPASPEDVLLILKAENNWVTAGGALKTIDDAQIHFNWNGADRTIGRKTVPVIRMAVTDEERKPAAGTLTGPDGSTLAFTTLTLGQDGIHLAAAAMGERKVPLASAASVRFHSDRVQDLAEMKPRTVREYGLFGRPGATTQGAATEPTTMFPHRVNGSTAGGPLKLGGRTFRGGLGLHSFCEMTYDLQGACSMFVAVAGIDDAVRPLGDATVVFLGDGKPLGEPLRLTGKDGPQVVRLPVKDVREFIIRVEFGPDGLDVGDHVDLAGARFVK